MIRHAVTVIALLAVACAGAWASPISPVVPNPGFEDGAAGWGWMAYNGVRASYRVEDSNPHSGKRCMAFSNASGVAPHVYGRLSTTVEVLPDTQYEFSCCVRGTDVVGNEGANHFTDWNSYQLNLPTGSFDWQRRSTTFKTKPGQYYLTIGLNVANKIGDLAIDDVSLRAIGSPIKGTGVEGSFLLPARVIGHNAPGYVGVEIKTESAVTLEAVVTSGDRTVFAGKKALKPGESIVEWEWDSGKVPFGPLECGIFVLDRGDVIARAEGTVEKADSPISADIDKAEERFKEFNALYARCKAKGIPLDYQTVTKTTLEQMIPLARIDIQRGHDWRAKFAAKDFMRLLDEDIARMQAYLIDPSLAPNARRFRTGKVSIDGPSFIGDRVDARGKKDRGPVFFVGHGAFGGVRRDMPRWPGYGVNIIQIETGPAQTLVSEDEVDLKAINEIAETLDKAAKQNVRVDVLLSPHYFPQWALDKWPHLLKGGGGFLGYCVDAPEAKRVVEKFLRTIIPRLKDKTALNSFCLSNEPIFTNTSNCENTKPMWTDYLRRMHGDVRAMNESYRTSYSSFEEVPIPGNEAYDAPQFYDYCVFNQERFAAWHEWMASVIRGIAPNVPIHAKVMSMALPHRFTVSWGCDPELFGALSDINGNDCLIRGQPSGGWAIPWHTQNMSYDLQRSLAPKPIFNSENHPTDDRSTYYVPPEHFRTAIWQGAVHGQGATTFWVWERSYDPASDLYGNVMDRPGCTQAVGTTCLDLNRFAEEVTALQKVKSPVAILFSMASIAQCSDYLPTVHKAYEALNFCGVKVDFISEKQLVSGKGRDYRLIVVPEAHRLPADADRSLTALPESVKCVVKLSAADLFDSLWAKLDALGALPDVRVVDAQNGKPIWGVEWLPVNMDGRTVVNIVNLTDKPVDVRITRNGSEIEARDLLSLGGRARVGGLLPITPVLAEVSR